VTRLPFRASASLSSALHAMKVMLRPLSSFLGFADLKTGALLALFFALLNKVAGVYGLVAALTGAIADAGQLSLYVYSAGALALLLLALRAVTDVRPRLPPRAPPRALTACRRTRSGRSTSRTRSRPTTC
jgi:hypothetical protein